MSWGKREVVNNFISLGDGDDDVTKTGGILTRIVKNSHYDKMDYEFVGKDGELAVLSGQATLARQISPDDMGKFFKAEFKGWGKSANGKYKVIEVYIWDGEPNEAMKAWPKFATYYGKKSADHTGPSAAKKLAEKVRDDFDDFADPPKALAKAEDDDLPF
jgi:hypothetical protein